VPFYLGKAAFNPFKLAFQVGDTPHEGDELGSVKVGLSRGGSRCR